MDLNEEQKAKLSEILEVWDSAHRAIRFLVFLGKILSWFLPLGAAATMIWNALHCGGQGK